MSLLIVSASLNSDSNSRLLAREAERVLRADGVAVEFLDLRELPLPLCDGEKAYGDPKRLISLTPGMALPDPKPVPRATKVNYRGGWTLVLRWSAGERRGCADSGPSRASPRTEQFDPIPNIRPEYEIQASAMPKLSRMGLIRQNPVSAI